MSTFNPSLLVVYPCLTGLNRNTQARANATPSVEVVSGAVNIYTSNNPRNLEAGDDNGPADKTEMTLLSTSPAAVDLHAFNASCNWVLFEEETATALVQTTNLIEEV